MNYKAGNLNDNTLEEVYNSDLMKEISDSGDYNKEVENTFKEALGKFVSTQSW